MHEKEEGVRQRAKLRQRPGGTPQKSMFKEGQAVWCGWRVGLTGAGEGLGREEAPGDAGAGGPSD